MPLAGGAADKFGNRYEHWWTVSQFVQMLHGEAGSIRIEDPGVAKAEFVVTKGGKRELHQAKRSHPDGKWSLSSLSAGDTELLQSIFGQLSGNDARFVFVSSSDARELAELIERATHSETVEEFEKRFVGTKKEAASFAKLRKIWKDADVTSARDVLRRIQVRTIDEKSLEERVRFGLTALFLADPDIVAQALWKIADDSIHKTVTRDELVANLDKQGLKLRRLTNANAARALINQVTDRYLDGARRKLIRRTLIPRSATQTLLKRLQENKGSDSVITGTAGGGKTGCVIELVDELRKREVPVAVLAFRLDRLKPVSNTAELGRQLGLEESPALVLAAAAAEGGEAALIVDQLDAVSTASGRNSDFFDAIEGLLNEARGLRDRVNLHVMVVCREFDWQNDHRLRRLLSNQHAKVGVGDFSGDEVKAVLEAEGFRSNLFHSSQLALLRLPQNLSLFLEAGFDPSKSPRFNSAKELFDRYWDEKRRSVAARTTPLPDQWGEIIAELTDQMTATQQLSAPRGKLDRFAVDYLQQMASEGVLTFDGERYGFGHESFFDYCFARRFVADRRSLSEFLISGEQHLFHRAQVRQVLAYLRDADRARYLPELRELLNHNRVRVHIKDLAVAFLTNVSDPTDEEWQILEPWLNSQLDAIQSAEKSSDAFTAIVWNRFFVSQSWFGLADQRGLVAAWMASPELANIATDYLRLQQRHSGDRVAELLEPYLSNKDWPGRIQHIMQWAELENSRRFFELFLRLIDDGTLDAARGPIAVNSTFWSMLYGLAQKRPAWVAEVIAHWLKRRQQVLLDAKGDDGKVKWRDLFAHDQFAGRHFHESADAAPQNFVENVLPAVLQISDAAIPPGDYQPPKRDAVWPIFFNSEYEMPDSALLSSLTSALENMAKKAPDKLQPFISDLKARETYVSNALLLNIYAAAPKSFAQDAAGLLVQQPWRFQCGFSDSPFWTSMRLIKEISPHLNNDDLSRLENVIVNFATEYELSAGGHHVRGRSSFSLLSAIPANLRSKSGRSRFQELERKFRLPDDAPEGIRGGTVQSPIDRPAAEKMTDEQWMKAIAKYDSEYSHPPNDFLKGGAWELAGLFQDFVRNEPERFAKLCLRLPRTTNPAYFDRALAALKETDNVQDLKFQLCRKVFDEHQIACGSAVADLLGSMKDKLPDDLIAALSWLATKHPSPEKELWNETAAGGTPYYGGDILTHGINTTRGRAAEAIRDLIFRDPDYINRFEKTLRELVHDPSLAIRACVASTLLAVANTRSSFARDLFYILTAPKQKWVAHWHKLSRPVRRVTEFRNALTWVDRKFAEQSITDDRLLATHYVDRFVYHSLRHHFNEMRGIIERMLRSAIPELREAGAILASLASLYKVDETLVNEAMTGDPSQRLGVAKVAAANIADPASRPWCENRLLRMFNDDDVEVRRETALCFRALKDERLEEYSDLIKGFINSKAYETESTSILFVLDESTQKLPGITADVCEKFLARFGDEARDIRTSRSADAHMIAKLVFRTYHQHETDKWGPKCLDLIDQMCLAGLHEVSTGLAEFER